MTTIAVSPADVRTRPLPSSILKHALLAGIAGDVLLRGSPGLGLPVWVFVLVLVAMSLTTQAGRAIPAQAAAWLLAALLFSTGFAWRDSEMLRVLDALATIGALGMTALTLSNPRVALFANRLRDTVWGAAATGMNVAFGLGPLLLRVPQNRIGGRRRVAAAFRAGLIALAVMVVFGSLLRSADPIFASLIALPGVDVDQVLSHVVIIGFCAWVVGGWVRSSLLADAGKFAAPDLSPVSLGLLDITAAMGTLILLFSAFVATQLGWFFGGERFLHARTGLTAAQYARGGFFQMVWVVLLVVGALLATRAMLHPGRALARRHTALSLPVVVLLAAIIVSAAMRMRLYVHYYGLTIDRFYTLVFMGWLGVVLVWLTLTVLRGWGRPFVAGTVLSGLAILAALNIASPDLIVARVNLSRTGRPSSAQRPPLDLVHLASLSGEAVDLAVAAIVNPSSEIMTLQRCDAARLLETRWGPASPRAERRDYDASWRSWNAGESHAIRVVAEHDTQLREVCQP